MKYIRQLMIILFISLLGEVLNYYLPLPIPASIYGMIILFTLLITGALKLEAVRDVGMFLVEIMPIMFIPASVGLMTSWGILQPLLIPVVAITVATLLLVMIISGLITQRVIRQTTKEAVSHE